MHDRQSTELPGRRSVMKSIGGMLGAGSGGQLAAMMPVSVMSQPPANELVSVLRFGAVPDGRTDCTAAFDAAIEHAAARNQPIWIPAGPGSYRIARTIHPRTGLIGQGRGSVIEAKDAASFADGSPLVRIGWTPQENPALCTVPVQGFRVVGAGVRPQINSSDPNRFGFAGTGILYDQNAAFIHAMDVGADGCLRGIDHAAMGGHIGGTAIQCSNNWYNLYWQHNTGDYRYFDCIFTGAVFASYGCSGSSHLVGDTGGISGLTMIGCHAGFSPFVFFQEDGDGTVGINGWTAINSSCEQVGNQVVRLGVTAPGKHRVCAGWFLVSIGHTWTMPGTPEHKAFAILDGSAPCQQRAIDLDLVQGQPLIIQGDNFSPGVSGYHTRIRDLLAWVRDDNGIGGYEITRQGVERLVYASAPVLRQQKILEASLVLGAEPTVIVFNIPPAYDNTPWAEFRWTWVHDNPGADGVAVTMIATVEGRGADQPQTGPVQYLRAGRGNIAGSFRIALGRRDRHLNRHQVRLALKSDSRGRIGMSGAVELLVAQDSGIVG